MLRIKARETIHASWAINTMTQRNIPTAIEIMLKILAFEELILAFCDAVGRQEEVLQPPLWKESIAYNPQVYSILA